MTSVINIVWVDCSTCTSCSWVYLWRSFHNFRALSSRFKRFAVQLIVLLSKRQFIIKDLTHGIEGGTEKKGFNHNSQEKYKSQSSLHSKCFRGVWEQRNTEPHRTTCYSGLSQSSFTFYPYWSWQRWWQSWIYGDNHKITIILKKVIKHKPFNSSVALCFLIQVTCRFMKITLALLCILCCPVQKLTKNLLSCPLPVISSRKSPGVGQNAKRALSSKPGKLFLLFSNICNY